MSFAGQDFRRQTYRFDKVASNISKRRKKKIAETMATQVTGAAEAITKSTGKSPPPGRGGGVVGITRMPGTWESGPMDCIINACALFFRSLQGFVTIPPNPPFGEMIWKMLPVSGIDR